MRSCGRLPWTGRHALKAVTFLGGRQDPVDQNGCGEKQSEWSMGQRGEDGSQDSGAMIGTANISSTKKSNIRKMAQLVKCLLCTYEV